MLMLFIRFIIPCVVNAWEEAIGVGLAKVALLRHAHHHPLELSPGRPVWRPVVRFSLLLLDHIDLHWDYS
jgi:hypothetical protein